MTGTVSAVVTVAAVATLMMVAGGIVADADGMVDALNDGCCVIRGDIDHSGVGPDIADLVYLVDYMFAAGPEPPCIEEADIDGSGSDPEIADLVYLVDYIFMGGPAPEPCPDSTCPPTVTDYDGNVYQTVLIGDQCWMMENLKVTHYRNGEAIPHVTDSETWAGLTTGAYCNYGNDEGNVSTYGRLYNWYAVDDSRKIAPEGWHVATDEEWKQLEMFLGMSQAEADTTGWRGTDEGGKLKEAGTTHWASPNTGATNESGFTALPGGYRHVGGNFHSMYWSANFWSSTELSSLGAWYRTVNCDYSQVLRTNVNEPTGFSVRCVRD